MTILDQKNTILYLSEFEIPPFLIRLSENNLCQIYLPDFVDGCTAVNEYRDNNKVSVVSSIEDITKLKNVIIYAKLSIRTLAFANEFKLKTSWPFICDFSAKLHELVDSKNFYSLRPLIEDSMALVFESTESKLWLGQQICIKEIECFIHNSDFYNAIALKGDAMNNSKSDSEIHTVLIGCDFIDVAPEILSTTKHGVHLHVYCTLENIERDRLRESNLADLEFLHFHAEPDNPDWPYELARYHAGWLNIHKSSNFEDIRKMTKTDVFYPDHYFKYISAGLPIIQWNNVNHFVASQSLSKKYKLGLFFNDIPDLIEKINENRNSHPFGQKINSSQIRSEFDRNQQVFIDLIQQREDHILRKTTSCESIPKTIHQTWKNTELPEHFKILVESWIENHPDWQYKLWTDEMNRKFVEKHFPLFLRIYDLYPSNIQRVDAVRYLVLYIEGGVFIDIDYECLDNIDPLTFNESVIFGSEPKGHCQRFGTDLIVSNAFMGCSPKNSFFERICDVLEITQIRDDNSLMNTLETTGPFFLTKLYKNYEDKTSVKIVVPEQICPLTIEESRLALTGNIDQKIQDKLDNAFAVHYFWGNWWKDLRVSQA